jgi:protein-tyrosine-phosphatase/predicted ATP-grasp superfamily ATP-dependent carboligase
LSSLNADTRSNARQPGKVLVLGDDTRSFLATVRSLGRRGLCVHVAPIDLRSPALRSRYVARIHRLPPYPVDRAKWVEAMHRLLTVESFDLVIPCDDRFVLPFDAHRDSFRTLTTVAIPSTAAITTLFNKEKTKALAASVGVNLAKTATLTECQTPQEAFDRLGSPVVVKPKSSYGLAELYSRARVRIVDTPEALSQVIAGTDPALFYFESFFQGSGVGLSVLADDGRIVLAFQHHRVHQAPEGGASPYRVSAAVSPELTDACARMLGALSYTGVAMFEFRRNFATGAWILLEVNARPWGSMPLPVALGVDFPYAWYRLLVEKTPPPPQSYKAGIYGRNFILDLMYVRQILEETPGYGAKLRVFGEWLFSFRTLLLGREHSDTLVVDDLRPGLVELAQSLGWLIMRILRDVPFNLQIRRWAARRALRAAIRSAARDDRKFSIVFVCQGNICRSPFAALLLAQRVESDNKMVTVASAGTMPVEGRSSPENAIAAARGFGVDMASHRSQYASDSLIETASVLLVFDEINAAALRTRFLDVACPIIFLGALTSAKGDPWRIRDPVDGDRTTFERSFGVIERAVRTVTEFVSRQR